MEGDSYGGRIINSACKIPGEPGREHALRFLFNGDVRLILVNVALVALTVASPILNDLQAVELPYRSILLGEDPVPHIDDLGTFEHLYVRIDSRYDDFYYMKSADESHDYHLSDVRITALLATGSWLFGCTADRDALTLSQDNVYTDADRLRGGRKRGGARLLIGLNGRFDRRRLGLSSVRLLASAGWEKGAAASLDCRLAFGESVKLSFEAAASPGEIDLSEEINGYRFPFYFPLRTELVSGGAAFIRRSFSIRAGGGVETIHGEGEARGEFENKVYHRRIFASGALRFRADEIDRDVPLYHKTIPSSPVPGAAVSISHSDGTGDLGMYHHGVRYLLIRDALLDDTAVEAAVVPLERSWIFAGWERLRARLLTSESFFDVWPFSIWDVFQAKRYRFGPVDSRLDIRYLGVGTHYVRRRFEIELLARWEWWDDATAIRWLEREEILYPIFFHYIPHDEDLDITYRYGVRIDPAFSFRVGPSVAVRLSGRIVVPLGREEEKRPAPPGPAPPPRPSEPEGDKTVHGGLFGRLSIVCSF